MDEKKIDNVQEIQDENLEGASGGILKMVRETSVEDEGEDAFLNPFVCPICRKSVRRCTCHS